MGALEGQETSPEFRPRELLRPYFMQRLSALHATLQGPLPSVTVLLDTRATQCFVCSLLAAALGFPPSGWPGPVSKCGPWGCAGGWLCWCLCTPAQLV